MRFYADKTLRSRSSLRLKSWATFSRRKRVRETGRILWKLTEKRRQGGLERRDRAALSKALYITRRGSSFGQLRSINLKMTPELLWKIDNAARDQGMDRSNWIRSVCTAALSEPPDLSRPGKPQLRINNAGEVVEEAEVVDKRAREIIRVLLNRVRSLEEGMRTMNYSPVEMDPFD